MLCQKILNHLTLVDRMAIPDQDDGTGYPMENLLKEGDHFCTCETMPIRTNTQTNSFAFWRDQQPSQQVKTLVMIDGSPLDRCLTPPRPGSFERRNKRKTAFIFLNEGSVQLATLFLSWVVPLSSTALQALRDCLKSHPIYILFYDPMGRVPDSRFVGHALYWRIHRQFVGTLVKLGYRKCVPFCFTTAYTQ